MAETFKFGNTKWAVKNGSVLAYNDENNNFKPLPFTFTRASTATRVNEDGLIEVVKSGIPRIDYTDNPDGHLLLEPSRLNLVTYSESFSSSYWFRQNSEISSATGITSPDGSNNAVIMSTSTTLANSGIRRFETTSFKSKTLTISVFAKKNTSDYIYFNCYGSTGSLVSQCWFNISDGTLGSNSSGSDWTNRKIENYSNGWHRCSATISFDSTDGDYLYIFQSDANNNALSTAGKQTYLYGAQIEEGSYATSYIPTDGDTETRVAETCLGAGNAQVFNDSEGVLFANVAALANSNAQGALSLSNGSLGQNIYIYNTNSAGAYNAEIYNSTSQANLTASGITKINFNKIAVKYKTNDFALWINGNEESTDNSGNAPTNLNVVSLNYNGAGSLPFYGKIKQIGVYDTALTDEELETLTT